MRPKVLLHLLHSVHTATRLNLQAHRSYSSARDSNFDNVNLKNPQPSQLSFREKPELEQDKYGDPDFNWRRFTSHRPKIDKLTHVTERGDARMVAVHEKAITVRTAKAVGYINFTNPGVIDLILDNQNKKGDVMAVARIAGIMAAKKTPEIIPLCHAVAISQVLVDFRWVKPTRIQNTFRKMAVEILATVTCEGKTGVEMEALTAVSASALVFYDMCKAVDKEMYIGGIRMVEKTGGRSGTFKAKGWIDWDERPEAPEQPRLVSWTAPSVDEEDKGIKGVHTSDYGSREAYKLEQSLGNFSRNEHLQKEDRASNQTSNSSHEREDPLEGNLLSGLISYGGPNEFENESKLEAQTSKKPNFLDDEPEEYIEIRQKP